ncbi:MAG: nodulation protein NfeD [Acidobacteria bacterium]|nr:nodulation protein NfeD [Acidobacteriota bacterium]
MDRRTPRFPLPLALATLFAFAVPPAFPQTPRVIRVDLDHVIHPLSAEIVRSGLAQADKDHAAAVVVRLNTPGGLLTATEEIIQAIVASPVPVVCWVGPRGGKAASAGFMILVSGDVAAMASGTNTGAAHPVALGGEMDEIMMRKVENDTAARIRSIVDKRGRNVELAEEAVLASRAFTEQEALESNLIEIIADDIPSLLEQLNGRTVLRFDGSQTTLETAGAQVIPYELNLRQRILLPLIDPSLAFILMALGVLGIYVEFTHPGLVAPGVIGALLTLVGAMALSLLPINWAGAGLLILGVACLVAEAFVVSGGLLTVAGAVAMVLGAVMLIDTSIPELSIGWGTAIAVAVPFAAITVFLLQLAVRSFKYKVSTGSEGMVGEVGVAKTEVAAKGQVFVHGELWSASAATPIAAGARVRVVAVDGLRVQVEAAPDVGPGEPRTV